MKSTINVLSNSIEIDFPFTKRRFDALYINYKWKVFNFWFDLPFSMENFLVGFAKLNEYNLLYFLDLDKLVEWEYVCKDFKIMTLNLFWEKVDLILCFRKNQVKVIVLKSVSNVIFLVKDNKLLVKNKVLWTILYEKDIKQIFSENILKNDYTKRQINLSEKVYKKLEVINVYFFQNLFLNTKSSIDLVFWEIFSKYLNDFLFLVEGINKNKEKFFKNVDIYKVLNFYEINEWLNKNELSLTEKKFLDDLKKFLFFKNRYFLLLDVIWKYEKFFKEFNLISRVKIKLPNFENISQNLEKQNIEKFSEDIVDFMQSFMYLQYLMFNLKNIKDKIEKLNLDISNLPKKQEFALRLKILKNNLSKIKNLLKKNIDMYLNFFINKQL